jgi:tRNA pseudouridine65 synthase
MAELSIIYHDAFFVAVDKPAGMLVHPGRDPEPPEHIAMKVLRDQLGHYVYTVHRLDRPTSGILLFALTPEFQPRLQALFAEHQIQKTYRAVVFGSAPEEQTIDQALAKDEDSPERECRTTIRRLSTSICGPYALSHLEVMPKTGRLHQIRRHLAHIGHPIVCDYLYGDIPTNESIAELSGIPRMRLHAERLDFLHPESGEAMRLVTEVPAGF